MMINMLKYFFALAMVHLYTVPPHHISYKLLCVVMLVEKTIQRKSRFEVKTAKLLANHHGEDSAFSMQLVVGTQYTVTRYR